MEQKEKKKEVCGIIMPISASENYSAEHWVDVKNILDEVISDSGFVSNLVSDADEIGIIHNRIVSNIYNNPIIICDVSSKNPNVMFELGLRLAFDKATIIIKDDATNYNFDTAPIEHLTYPRDLRYTSMLKFKLKLKEKLTATYSASLKPEYSTFLKNFVQYKPKLEVEEISSQEYILKQLDFINKQLSELKQNSKRDYHISDIDYIAPKTKIGALELESLVLSKFADFEAKFRKSLDNMTKSEVRDMFIEELRKSNDSRILGAPISEVQRVFDVIYDLSRKYELPFDRLNK